MSDGDALVGTVLGGRYKLLEKQSEELLGSVYRGRNVVEDQLVQVKILHPHLATDNTRFGRFLREVQATSMVRHVNTIEMVDSGTHEGLHFLVMEFFPAHTLEAELQKGTLSVDRVAHIAAQVAGAIGAAHQESVTHRALSPRNILLLDNARSGDFVKVRDFGLSKLEHFDDEESTNLTEMGSRVGNTKYMAPEYIDRDRFHPKGDLYALGCLMYEMLVGEPPYTGRAAEVLSKHVVAPVPKPSEKRESVPEWMDDIVVALMGKSPEDRPGAYKLVAQLEDGIGHSLAPPALVDPAKGAVKRSRGPSKPGLPMAAIAGVIGVLVLLGGSVLAMLAVGLVLIFTWSPGEQPSAPPPVDIAVEQPAPKELIEPEAPVEPEEPVASRPSPSGARPAARPTPIQPTPKPVVQPVAKGRTSVTVKSNRKALVFLNGDPKGFAPITLHMPPGSHRIEAMLPSVPESRQKQVVKIDKGANDDVTFTF